MNYFDLHRCSTPLNSSSLANQDNIINKVSVYPNPFTNKINVSNIIGEVDFILSNTLGQIIFSGTNIQEKDLSFLEKGVYLLNLKSDNKNHQIIKVIKE